MTEIPATRPSLLIRLANGRDTQAWLEFVELYQPAVYRFLRSKGWQHADAEDLVQTVLAKLVQQVASWNPSKERGSFRGWLFRVAQNASLDALRRSRVRATLSLDGSEGGWSGLAEAPTAEWELAQAYRHEVFLRAAQAVQDEFQPHSWQAFVETHLNGRSIEDVAKELALSKASVYAARSRIVARLRIKVCELLAAQDVLSETRPLPPSVTKE